MGRLRFENDASWKLAAQITADTTEIPIESSVGLPVLNDGDYFYATMEEGQNAEVVRVDSIALNADTGGAVLTVQRAQDNTSPYQFNANVTIEMRVNAAIMRDVISERLALEQRTIDNAAADKAELTAMISANGAGGSTSQLVASAMNRVLCDQMLTIPAGSTHVFSHASDPYKIRSVFIEKEVPGITKSVEISQLSYVMTDAALSTIVDGAAIVDGPGLRAGDVSLDDLLKGTQKPTWGGFCGISTMALGDHTITAADGKLFGATEIRHVSSSSAFDVHVSDNGTDWDTVYSWAPNGAVEMVISPINIRNKHIRISMTGWDAGYENRYASIFCNGSEVGDAGANGVFDLKEYELSGLSVQGETILPDSISVLAVATVQQTAMVANNAKTALSFDDGATWGAFSVDHGSVAVPNGASNMKIKVLNEAEESDFASIVFDKVGVSSWLLDNETMWEVNMGLSTSTNTPITNVSGEDKSVRVRIGATSVLKYDFTKTIPTGSSEVLELPVAHGGNTVAHLKQYVPGDMVSDVKWDFDVVDRGSWDGGSIRFGAIGLEDESVVLASQQAPGDFSQFVQQATTITNTSYSGYPPMSDTSLGSHGELGTSWTYVGDAGAGNVWNVSTVTALARSGTYPYTAKCEWFLSDDGSSWVKIGESQGGVTGQDEVIAMDGAKYGRYLKIYHHPQPRNGHSLSIVNYDNTDLKILTLKYAPSSLITSLSPVSTALAESVSGVSAAESKPSGTDIRYALSFDEKQTWRGVGGVVVFDVATEGMTKAEMESFDFSSVSIGEFLDVAIALSSTDQVVTPTVDQISVNMTTAGMWAHTAANPDSLIVAEDGERTVLVTNNSGTEKTLRITVEV